MNATLAVDYGGSHPVEDHESFFPVLDLHGRDQKHAGFQFRHRDFPGPALGVAGGFNPPHLALLLPRGLVGDLRMVVQPLVLAVLDTGHQLLTGGRVAFKFVGHDHPGYVAQALEELFEKPLGGTLVAAGLYPTGPLLVSKGVFCLLRLPRVDERHPGGLERACIAAGYRKSVGNGYGCNIAVRRRKPLAGFPGRYCKLCIGACCFCIKR